MRDVALEIPLAALGFRGFGQRHHAGIAGVKIGPGREDRADLARGIAAFENRHDPFSRRLQPELNLDQFHLQRLESGVVLLPLHLLVVGKIAGGKFLFLNPFRKNRIVDVEAAQFAANGDLDCPLLRFFAHGFLQMLLCKGNSPPMSSHPLPEFK
ncbi:hypothetical protein D3C86_1732770 [compost metagenome]